MKPKEDLCSVFHKALEYVDPYLLMKNSLCLKGNTLVISHGNGSLYEDLDKYTRILVLGIGKASVKMAKALQEILGPRISEASVITNYGGGEAPDSIALIEAGHPVPDENSIIGAEKLCGLARKADEHTLIINLISGGGSALFSLPAKGLSLGDLKKTTQAMLKSGADIREMNCIRKHVSQVKGGCFAQIAYPARIISLILSDVVGDRLDTIASGITVPDRTTFGQALDIAVKYNLENKIPETVFGMLVSGSNGKIAETPKEGDPVFDRVTNIILGNNALACKAARDHGEKLGYNSYLITSSLTGEAREIAKFFTAIAKDIHAGTSDFKSPALIVAGGETTVTVSGKGKGGRNQELALSFLLDLMGSNGSLSETYFLSAGTDGIDGPTDAAGALIDPDIMKSTSELSVSPSDYLDNNDSYHFFEKTNGLFVTGPTGTNVCDLQLMIVPFSSMF
ncbi:MAG: glycerate kinase [Deltaproteobacteria bacterium HGW-Deltaproteobacteria-1]|jgi:hydroxypyruvate reductase|nr:MAG: glycerate kinase [Deltaproteobacteria bacterium HGW-Deltaproteobacteria-1]